MTRAAQRILDRARASAWRRVGIPATWNLPVRKRDEGTTPEAGAPREGATPGTGDGAGKNVAAEPGENPGTGRREEGPDTVTHDSTEP